MFGFRKLHFNYFFSRAVGARGRGGHVSLDFGRSGNPISTLVAYYAHHIATCPPPLIFRPSYALNYVFKRTIHGLYIDNHS